MPTVSLTAQQQSQVDAANQTLASAQAGYDKALSNFNAVKANFCDGWWNYLTNCDVKNAESKALTTSLSLLSPLGLAIHNWTQKKWEKPSSCQNAIDKGILLKWDCDRGKGDCKEVSGCNDRVNEYNAKLNGITNAAVQLDGASKLVQSAKDALNAVLDFIAKDPTVKNNKDLADKEIDAQKQKDMIKWLFFGLAAVLIVGGAIYIGTRMIKGGASAN